MIVTRELENGYDETEVHREFKIEAVRPVTDRGVAIASVRTFDYGFVR